MPSKRPKIIAIARLNPENSPIDCMIHDDSRAWSDK
jgi:hypothetical protein